MSQQTQPSATATADVIPAPGSTWVVDTAHTTVEFVVRHLMSKVRGHFASYTGQLVVGDTPEQSKVVADIETASINTNQDYRDNHLRSPDFFHVEQWPHMHFESTHIESHGHDRYLVRGDLTIRDVTKSVELDAEFLGSMVDAYGNVKLGFTAETEVDRYDFGLTWNAAVEGGNLLVARKVRIEINGQLMPAPENQG